MTTPITRWWQEGTGPLLVFVHGYAAHSAFWDPWMPELTRRYTCLRVDLPGFGQAPTPPGCDYSPTPSRERWSTPSSTSTSSPRPSSVIPSAGGSPSSRP